MTVINIHKCRTIVSEFHLHLLKSNLFFILKKLKIINVVLYLPIHNWTSEKRPFYTEELVVFFVTPIYQLCLTVWHMKMALAKWMKKYKKEVEFPSKEESKHHRRHSSYHPKNKCHVPPKIQQNKNRIRKGSGTTSEEESIEIESDEKVRENNTNVDEILTKYCVVFLILRAFFVFFFSSILLKVMILSRILCLTPLKKLLKQLMKYLNIWPMWLKLVKDDCPQMEIQKGTKIFPERIFFVKLQTLLLSIHCEESKVL